MIAGRRPQPINPLDYHTGTQHPDGALLDYRHRYLPGRRPMLFKRYRGLPQVELPIGPPAEVPAALSAIGAFSEGSQAPDLEKLGRVLHYSAGITKRLHGYQFRAAACTGALYHIELYVVCGELEGLLAGVYHYDPEGSRLLRLREGDHRGYLAETAGSSQAVRHSAVTLIYTDIYWRNAIKYQARAYRHAFWDAGTIVANTLAMAGALNLRAELVMGFADPQVTGLLGVDPAEELPLALLALGSGEPAVSDPSTKPAEIRLEWEPTTDGNRAFPVIASIHQATALEDGGQVRQWLGRLQSQPAEPEMLTPTYTLDLPPETALAQPALERVIRRRGSSRAFSRQPIQRDQLAVLLERSLRPIPAQPQSDPSLVHPYLIVNSVDRLEAGVYRVLPGTPLGLLRIHAGDFRGLASHLALGQALGGDAAVNVYYLAKLGEVLDRYGGRGYRLAQMEAAIRAGWGYLAAYAMGFGATGLTFYDELVEEFLGVAPDGLKVMFLLTLGVPASR